MENKVKSIHQLIGKLSLSLQKITTMRTIQFNKNITFEQYQMAVRVLEAIGLEVKKEEEFSAEIIEGIEQGWKELREGKGIPSEEVHKKARLY